MNPVRETTSEDSASTSSLALDMHDDIWNCFLEIVAGTTSEESGRESPNVSVFVQRD